MWQAGGLPAGQNITTPGAGVALDDSVNNTNSGIGGPALTSAAMLQLHAPMMISACSDDDQRMLTCYGTANVCYCINRMHTSCPKLCSVTSHAAVPLSRCQPPLIPSHKLAHHWPQSDTHLLYCSWSSLTRSTIPRWRVWRLTTLMRHLPARQSCPGPQTAALLPHATSASLAGARLQPYMTPARAHACPQSSSPHVAGGQSLLHGAPTQAPACCMWRMMRSARWCGGP